MSTQRLEKVRVGIVGAGAMGSVIASFFASHGGYQVTYVCDVVEKQARTLADPFGADATTNVDELISSPKVDLVYIVTPPKFHASMSIAALSHNKHVLVR